MKRVFWVIAVAAAVAGQARAAGPHKDAAHKFILDVPEGWDLLPPRDLATLNATSPVNEKFPTLVAFRPAGLSGNPVKGKHPLVMISATPTKRPELTFPEFEKEITFVFTSIHMIGGTNKLRVPLAFDEPRKRATVQAIDPVYGHYGAGFLFRDELLLLHGRSERKAYQDHVATFEKMADSFRYDDPNAAAAPPASPLEKYLGPINLSPNAQMAVVGAGVAILVLAVGAVLNKPKRRQSAF